MILTFNSLKLVVLYLRYIQYQGSPKYYIQTSVAQCLRAWAGTVVRSPAPTPQSARNTVCSTGTSMHGGHRDESRGRNRTHQCGGDGSKLVLTACVLALAVNATAAHPLTAGTVSPTWHPENFNHTGAFNWGSTLESTMFLFKGRHYMMEGVACGFWQNVSARGSLDPAFAGHSYVRITEVGSGLVVVNPGSAGFGFPNAAVALRVVVIDALGRLRCYIRLAPPRCYIRPTGCEWLLS